MADLDKISYHHYITELEANAEVFRFMLSDMPEPLYLWKPEPGRWCVLEVLCHLYDEEREDFRARIKHLFELPGEPLPSIDPKAWEKERAYMQQNFTEKLQGFLKERNHSVEWLKSLEQPNWKSHMMHVTFGTMSAEMLLTNWLAHDYLHIRQILHLKFEYIKYLSDIPLDYSGEWK